MEDRCERLVTVSFTRDALDIESLVALDMVLGIDPTSKHPLRIGQSIPLLDDRLPNLLRFWLEQMDCAGAFDAAIWPSGEADNRFMARLWEAHELYFAEVNAEMKCEREGA